MIQKYSNLQLWTLVILRVAIGWHFLYEGIIKLLNPNWSSVGYLMDSKGWFSGIFQSIAGNPDMLQVADFLNVWGMILIGAGLILGLFSRLASYGGIVLLALYYLSHPPLLNAVYAIPSEGSYMLVNKNLIELITLVVLTMFPTSGIVGLDRFIFRKGIEN
ncbi:MAG: DoxX family membrane protein [Bacteroidales bacterium]